MGKIQLDTDPNRVKRLAEEDDGSPVSAGGLYHSGLYHREFKSYTSSADDKMGLKHELCGAFLDSFRGRIERAAENGEDHLAVNLAGCKSLVHGAYRLWQVWEKLEKAKQELKRKNGLLRKTRYKLERLVAKIGGTPTAGPELEEVRKLIAEIDLEAVGS